MTLRLTEEQLEAFRQRQRLWDRTGHVITHRADPQEQVAAAPKRRRSTRGPSELELLLAQQITLVPELENPLREHKHIPDRDFRLDFAWPHLKIGLEVQGMVHRIKGRFKNDIEKRALGLLHGWRILEVGGAEIRSGQAIAWILELMPRDCDHVWEGGRCVKCRAKG